MGNDDFKIGTAAHNRKFGKANFTWCEDNTDLVLRVLPPLFSLAEERKYSQFYRVHRGMRGSDGKQKAFFCPEEMDWKTKLIKVHCPICDRYRELDAQLTNAKDKGASPEQIKEFRVKIMMPLQSEGKYYLNTVNQTNELKVLSIGSRHHSALKALFDEYDAKGVDLCGIKGYYIAFRKSTQFKGDKKAVHTAKLYQIDNGNMNFSPVAHEITSEFTTKLKNEASDLGKLFKVLVPEELAALAAASDKDRIIILDKIFAKPEETTGTEQSVPGPSAAPITQQSVPQAAPAPTPAPGFSFGTTAQAPTAALVTPSPVSQTVTLPSQPAPAPTGTPKVMSDEEFMRTFTPRG